MTDSTCALTHPRPLSLTQAMNACFAASKLSEVHLAHACLQKLLNRPKGRNEDDVDIDDGVAAIIRFISESMSRREDLAMAALRTLSELVERERAQAMT